MNAFLAYAVGTVILALLGLVVIFNFARYRFKGDQTILITTLFVVAFVAAAIFNLFLFVPEVARTTGSSF